MKFRLDTKNLSYKKLSLIFLLKNISKVALHYLFNVVILFKTVFTLYLISY